MGKTESAVLDFIRSMSETEQDVVQNIARLDLGPVLLEQLKELDRAAFLRASVLMMAQNVKNKMIEDELLTLSWECERHGVKLVHLKGLTLAHELYHPRERRVFGDVDVLVDPSQSAALFSVLDSLGYCIADTGEPTMSLAQSMKSLFSMSLVQHLPHVTRQISKADQEMSITLEVHCRLHPFIDTEEVVSRAIRQEMMGCSLWVLDLYDRFVHLATHHSQHFARCVFWSDRCDRENRQRKIRKFYDLALLYDKYQTQFDWQIVIERCMRNSACGPVLLAIRLLESVYGI